MATSGEVVELYAKHLGMGVGTLLDRLRECRNAGLVPTGGRGRNAAHYATGPAVNLLIAACVEPNPDEVVRSVRRTKSLCRDDELSRDHLFEGLAVAKSKTLGEALMALVDDSIAGRLAAWKAKSPSQRFPDSMFIDFVNNGRYVEICARRYLAENKREESELVFKRGNLGTTALSGFRVYRLDSFLFECLDELLTRSESRDPYTAERVLASTAS